MLSLYILRYSKRIEREARLNDFGRREAVKNTNREEEISPLL